MLQGGYSWQGPTQPEVRDEGGGSLIAQILTTDAVTPRQKVAFWQEMVCETFVHAACESVLGESFQGRISSETLDAVELSRIECGAQRIRRRKVDVSRSCKPRYYLCVHLSGQARYRERGLDALLGPGDMILLDNCEPYTAEYQSPVHSLVLHLPQSSLRQRAREVNSVVGRKLKSNGVLAAEVSALLDAGLNDAVTMSPEQASRFAELSASYLSCLLARDLGKRPDADSRDLVSRARIRRLIEQQANDPSLCIERLASQIGLSPRHINRLMRGDNTSFGRYLLSCRLSRCREQLLLPESASRPIGEIALQNGFNNFSHFSRVFRESLGCSPSTYRSLKGRP